MAIQICVFTAFSEVPKNALIRRCCLIHLKKSSRIRSSTYSRIHPCSHRGGQVYRVDSSPGSRNLATHIKGAAVMQVMEDDPDERDVRPAAARQTNGAAQGTHEHDLPIHRLYEASARDVAQATA